MCLRKFVCSFTNFLGNVAQQHRARAFSKSTSNALTDVSAAVRDLVLFEKLEPHLYESSIMSQQVASFERAVRQPVSDSIEIIEPTHRFVTLDAFCVRT